MRHRAGAAVVAALICASCAGGSDGASPEDSQAAPTEPVGTRAAPETAAVTTDPRPPPTTLPTTSASPPSSTTAPTPAPVPAVDVRGLVETLASDELEGRDNGSDGAEIARDVLIETLATFAEPAFGGRDGDDGFLQSFDGGINVLALIPGGELRDEFVIVGAHYDHLGRVCPTTDTSEPGDDICNGATDNATGTAAAVAVAAAVAAGGVPKRSVLIALWDAEEDGLLGSAAYVADPIVPLDQTVAYVNFDIQGATLLPTLAQTTFVIGAETGGQELVDASLEAAGESTLDTLLLSVIFGQGRSDHASFVGAGVPSAFFADSTSGCYHTVDDDLDAVSFSKLDQQIAAATSLAGQLADGSRTPIFMTDAPITTFDDAITMQAIARRAEPDFNLPSQAAQSDFRKYIADLDAIVEAGPGEFGESEATTLLLGAAAFVEAVATTGCSPAR